MIKAYRNLILIWGVYARHRIHGRTHCGEFVGSLLVRFSVLTAKLHRLTDRQTHRHTDTQTDRRLHGKDKHEQVDQRNAIALVAQARWRNLFDIGVLYLNENRGFYGATPGFRALGRQVFEHQVALGKASGLLLRT